jgi:class 3 adenylate cyclase/tetratricopeptide (TPR) repeat protein
MARKERKVVTVLFADLVGFTSRAETLDPEDVEAILEPYHARLREELERHGGTVEKFIGDAVMAVFGAPVAHEDDPERAVRAALAIRDWAADEGGVEVRIAVNTGEALVTLDARPEAGEGMVAGDVVNTAARLQAAAPVNGILVGETTHRATRGAIDYREHEPVEAKGKAGPVHVWQAVSARSRFGVDVVQESRAPLVGRMRELTLLTDAFARARAEREPQLVTLVGVPGIGKSRLVYELMQLADADPQLITWRQGRCVPYGEGVTFWALGEIVKSHAGILEDDPAERAEEKLRGVADDSWVLSHLQPLVGLSSATGHEDRLSEAFAAWTQFFEALADDGPLVLVVEDLHWADDKLLDFVDHLVDRAGNVPLLVVATARPELLERRPGWGGGKPNALTLSLSPLTDEDTARLLGALLERSVLPADTQQAVLARAGGNPLFAEQYARMFAERGDAEAVPETVQGIIAARLDGLAAPEKELLQNAAVFGKVFWAGALGDPHDLLHGLERKEFVRRQRRSSVAGETEYAFRHFLLRDVAYGQIPRAERADKHQLAAEWIDSLTEDRDDHVELLADHYAQALELARAAGRDTGELEARARVALRDAGDRASTLNSFAAASSYYAQALELWPQAGAERAELLFGLGRARWLSEQAGKPELAAALEGLLEADLPERAAEAAVALAEGEWHRGRRNDTDALLERALSLVEGLAASRAKAYVLSQASRSAMLAGRQQDAIRSGREAIAIADALGLEEIKAHALNNVGTARVNVGDRTGVADVEASVEIARRLNSPEVVRCLNNLAYVLGLVDEPKRQREAHEEAERAAERFGLAGMARFLRSGTAWHHFGRGEWDEALRQADALLAEVEAGSPHYLEGATRYVRARIRLGRGDLKGALADTARAVAVARDAGDPQAVYPSLVGGAWALMAAGREAEARRLAEEFFERASGDEHIAFGGDAEVVDTMARLLGPERLRELLARSAGGNPHVDAAECFLAADFVAAAEIYERLESRPAAAFCRLEAARAAAAAGRPAEANDQLGQALAFYRSVGATRYIREGEALLAATA